MAVKTEREKDLEEQLATTDGNNFTGSTTPTSENHESALCNVGAHHWCLIVREIAGRAGQNGVRMDRPGQKFRSHSFP